MNKKILEWYSHKNEAGSISNGALYFFILLTVAIGALLTGGVAVNQQGPVTGEPVAINIPLVTKAQNNLQLYTFIGATYTPTPLPTVQPTKSSSPVMADCGHIITQTREPQILYAYELSSSAASGNQTAVKVWYDDEWPLTLGSGSVSQMKVQPGDHITGPNVGDQTARDPSNLPYFPALFLTDITTNPQDQSGDAESGGTPILPDDVYGAWKPLGAPERLGTNDCNGTYLAGGDALPANPNGPQGVGAAFSGPWNRGVDTTCTAEIIWKIPNLKLKSQPLVSGHIYRAEFIIHDGDRDGDVGEACVTINMP